jgi:hypothetical protein
MRYFRTLVCASFALLAAVSAGCGGGLASGLVVIPPEVANAKADEGKYKGIHAIYLYDIGYVA